MKHISFLLLLLFTWPLAAAAELLLSGSSAHQRFRMEMREGASATLLEFSQGESKPSLTVSFVPDKNGLSLTIRGTQISGTEKTPLEVRNLIFWPPEKDAKSLIGLAGAQITEQRWYGRTLPGVVRADSGGLKVWLEGRLILNHPAEAGVVWTMQVAPGKETTFAWESGAWPEGRYEPLPMAHLANAKGHASVVEKEGIPFELWDEGKSTLPLARAGWPEWRADLHFTCERQDGSSRLYLMDEGQIPFAQVPKADYVAAWVLASAKEEPGTTNAFTLRAGRRNGEAARVDSQLLQYDFASAVPTGGKLQLVRVPLGEGLSQNVGGGALDIELTKEIRLARRSPDPNRYRWRPLGLPSNVTIAAVTLEKSPIQMNVRPIQAGGVFVQPEPVAYRISLTNITPEPREAIVVLEAGGASQTLKIPLPPGASVEEEVALGLEKPGYHPISVALSEQKAGPLFTHRSTLGLLPPDTRKHRAQAPWGTWDFGGAHFTPTHMDEVGPVMQKLGLRYGMFKATAEERERYGIIKGNETKVSSGTKEPEKAAEAYRALKEKHPDLLDDYLIFHENAISGGHAVRVPDLFHDRPPYQLNEAEKKEFQRMWNIATVATRAMRKEYPHVKLLLGNGLHTLKEEFYRNQFPAELFDAAGNESAGFGRPPESQPPDGVAVNAAIWMDRQLLDAYGYKEKPVYQCSEVIYPATNPGNLSLQTQANYFIRHILHAMAWQIPKVRPGCIADVGNSYYGSNWGASGLMTRRPEWTPKPAAIALATLTRVLDGASYQGFVETGSESLYLLHFKTPEGTAVYPFWTVRGQREIRVEVEGAATAKLTTQDGVTKELPVREGSLTLTASATPAWLQLPAGATLRNATPGEPRHPGAEPRGKVSKLAPLDSLTGWKLAPDANPLLDYYNPMTPRRKGDFAVEAAEGALKVAPRPIPTGKPTMPMYAELVSEAGLPLPGKPAEAGLWVEGNSGWGRIILELEDATGQKWTSIGARSKGGSDWMADWLGEKGSAEYKPGEVADWNTDDVFGLSRINFDGWRYIGIPLPGQYPGEGYHWPANSQWRWDRDGIVHYPLKLTKLIVELPEKTLYLNRFEAPRRAEIRLRDLVSVEREVDTPKTTPHDYVEQAQVTID